MVLLQRKAQVVLLEQAALMVLQVHQEVRHRKVIAAFQGLLVQTEHQVLRVQRRPQE